MKAIIRRCDLLSIWSPQRSSPCFVAANQELEEILSLPGNEKKKKKRKGQYEAGMKLQMFQFIFISMAFHYGRKWMVTRQLVTQRGSRVQALQHHAQITHRHTQYWVKYSLSRRHHIHNNFGIYICWHSGPVLGQRDIRKWPPPSLSWLRIDCQNWLKRTFIAHVWALGLSFLIKFHLWATRVEAMGGW